MAIRMVTRVGDEDFSVTLSRDDAGHYVAEASPVAEGEHLQETALPRVRVVDPVKERALRSLFSSLARLTSDRATRKGPDAPAAA
jgi:hypothetical protein